LGTAGERRHKHKHRRFLLCWRRAELLRVGGSGRHLGVEVQPCEEAAGARLPRAASPPQRGLGCPRSLRTRVDVVTPVSARRRKWPIAACCLALIPACAEGTFSKESTEAARSDIKWVYSSPRVGSCWRVAFVPQ